MTKTNEKSFLKIALVPLAQGIEEIEVVTIIDVLVRGGIQVITASITENKEITCSRGVVLKAEFLLDDLTGESFDLIAVAGGAGGAENFSNSATLETLLKEQKIEGRLYAAICASPAAVFSKFGLVQDKAATCYPSFADRLDAKEALTDDLVVDGNCITSRGPATAMTFALKLVELLEGKEKRDQVASGLLYSH
ncbi:MAG: DJ-1/PfpI family protein [SAR324 cluster bacterium]|nr:DJ-1/PfpI family protein [SAR324 cluster bacterium]